MSAALLQGCATGALTNGQRSAKQTGKGCQIVFAGWCDFTVAAAREAWIYAQLSRNAYGDAGEDYKLPADWTRRIHVGNDYYGFAYAIFDRREENVLKEVVIAFRGTENDDLRDWRHGNFRRRQNFEGLGVVNGELARLAHDGLLDTVKVIVTGHSLGGGIAHNASLRRFPLPGNGYRTLDASYVFNNSPNYRAESDSAMTRRLAVVERGELLKITRGPANEATQRYVSLNCTPGFRPFGDHAIRQLADCLTWIAAGDKDEKAIRSRNANGIQRPETEPTGERAQP